MIHYHGTPITPNNVAPQVLSGRHAMVSYAQTQQVAMVAEICQSFAIDNGAFTAWTQGKPLDIGGTTPLWKTGCGTRPYSTGR